MEVDILKANHTKDKNPLDNLSPKIRGLETERLDFKRTKLDICAKSSAEIKEREAEAGRRDQ